LIEIDNVLIKKCTSDDWSVLVSILLKDCLVNRVSNKLFQFLSLVVAKLADINVLWKCNLETCVLVVLHLLLSTASSHLIWPWLATCLSDSAQVWPLTALL
jgi:hypothetical protein